MVKVLQSNLKRKVAAHDMALVAAMKHGADLLVAGEPNKKFVHDNTGWIKDRRIDVAILILNKNVKVRKATREEGYIVLELEKGLKILATYISPNINIREFQRRLDGLMSIVEPTNWVIMGDFNSKAPEWGSPVTDPRGREVCEWIAALNLTVHNDGQKPTCITANGESFIDLTLSTPDLTGRVRNWRIEEDLTLSDHPHIHFELTGTLSVPKRGISQEKHVPLIDYRRVKRELFESLTQLRAERQVSYDSLSTKMSEIQKRHTARAGNDIRRVPYWWSEEVEEMRAECSSRRRAWLRLRRTGAAAQETEEARIIMKECKKTLVRLIRREKRTSWKELCGRLEEDVWGQAYKIVTKQLKGLRPAYDIPTDAKLRIARELFPAGDEHQFVRR